MPPMQRSLSLHRENRRVIDACLASTRFDQNGPVQLSNRRLTVSVSVQQRESVNVLQKEAGVLLVKQRGIYPPVRPHRVG